MAVNVQFWGTSRSFRRCFVTAPHCSGSLKYRAAQMPQQASVLRDRRFLGACGLAAPNSRSHSLRCRTGQLCSVWLPDHRRRARHLAPWCAKTAAISPQKKASPRQQRCPPPRSHSPLGALSHKAGWPSINQSVNDMTQAHWPISAIASRSAWRYESAPAWIPAQYLERWYTSSSEGRAV